METGSNPSSLPDYVGGKVKGFWERREGTTGMVAIALVAVTLFVGWGVIAPFVVATLLNTVYAGILVAFLTGVFTLRKVLMSMFQSGCRAITRLWANIDPIGIQEEDLLKDKRELSGLDKNLDELDAQIVGLEEEEKTTQNSIADAMEMVKEARDKLSGKVSPVESQGLQSQLILSGNEASRQRDYLTTLQNLKSTFTELYQFGQKWRGHLDFLIKDRESFIKISKKNRKISITGQNMVERMKGILHVDPDRVYLVNAAIEAQADQFNRRVGVIRNFAKTYRDTLVKGDLRNEMNAKQALRQLEEWERQQGTSVLQQVESRDSETTHPLASVPVTENKVSDNKDRMKLFQ